MTDPFSNPRGGGSGLPISELEGRLVAFVVKGVEQVTFKASEGPKTQVTADVYVLDGGPLMFGGSYPTAGPQTPPTHQVQVPAYFGNVRYGNVNIVTSLQDSVGGGPVVGIIERSTFGNKPWNLAKLEPENPRRIAAVQFWTAVVMPGTWAPPVPVPLPGRAAPIPGANPYGQPAPAQMTQSYGPVQPGQWAPQAPVQYPPAQVAPAPQQPVQQPPAQQWAPQAPTQAGQWGGPPVPPQAPTQATAAQPWQAQAPAAAQGEFIPPGYEPVWNNLAPEEKARVLASFNAQAPTQAGQWGGPPPF